MKTQVPIALEGSHFSMSHIFFTVMIILFPWLYFCVPPNPDAHATSKFLKRVHRNPTTPTADHNNNWESAGLMDIVVAAIAIPYPRFGVIINILSKEDISYNIIIGDIPHCTCPDFTKMSSHVLGKKKKCIANIFIMCLGLCARWIMTVTSLFTLQHMPTMRSYDYLNLPVL